MSGTFKHILVPVDFSGRSLAAIDVARSLSGDASISLLHVIERIDLDDNDSDIVNFYEKLQSRATDEFERLVELFANDPIDLRFETVVENRTRGIVAYAMQNDVDLIVMSSHPVDLKDRSVDWGTISYQVSALCPCSVMLVKNSGTAAP